MTRETSHQSIVRNFGFGVAVSFIVVAAAVLIFSMVVSAQRAERELRARSEILLAELTQLLKSPLWNYNDREIKIIANAYLQNPSIGILTITGSDGRVLFSREKPTRHLLFVRESQVVYKGETIGQVRFTVSGDYQDRLSRDFLWSYVVTVLSVLLITLLVAGLMLRLHLKRPMGNFIELVEAYSSGNLGALRKGPTFTEFEPLVRVLEAMGQSLNLQMEALRENQRNLAQAQRMAQLGSWDWDIGKQSVIWSDQMFRVLGLDPEQFVPKLNGFYPLLHPEDQTAMKRALTRALKDPAAPLDIKLRCIKPDGTEIWVHARGEVTQWEGDTPLRMSGTLLDITERRRFEAEITELNRTLEGKVAERTLELSREIAERSAAEEKLQRIFTLSPDLIGSGNLKGFFIQVNPAFRTLLGYDEADFCSRPFLDYVHKDDQEATAQALIEAAQGTVRDVFTIDNRYRCKDGRYLWIAWVVLAVVEQDVFYAFGRDVTERIKAETELRQAHKMEALGNLAGGTAHTLNNLLLPILALSEVIRDEFPADGREYQMANTICQAAHKSREVVSRMLVFSRQNRSHLEFVDLGQIVRDSVDLVRVGTPSSIAIDTEIDLNDLMVYADPSEIETVVMNLVTNSVAALDKSVGAIHISVSVVSLDENVINASESFLPGDYAKISVNDDGEGISPEIIDRIFDPFFTTKDVGKGTGLGLAMVDGIARHHGGGVTVASTRGGGTTFNLYIPLANGLPAQIMAR